MLLGLSSGVPGVYDVPEGNNDTHFARSLNRIKEGRNKIQVTPDALTWPWGAVSPTNQVTQSIS